MSQTKIIYLMLSYGAILGGLAGGIVCGIMFLWLPNPDTSWVSDFLFGYFFGSIFGVIFGCIAALGSGLILAESLPRWLNPSNIRLMRVGMGSVTAIVTTIAFAPLFIVASDRTFFRYGGQNDDLFAGLIFSIGLSVYACQRVITKYLRETDLRKAKGKSHA